MHSIFRRNIPVTFVLGILLLFALSIAIALRLPKAKAVQQTGAHEVALAAGRAITEADLEAVIRPQLKQLEAQKYQLERDALEQMVGLNLIRSEAKQQNLTPDELVRREADSKAAPVTEADARQAYAAQADRWKRPFEEVRAHVEQEVRQSRTMQERQAFVRRLREKYPVTILLQPPRTAVSAQGERAKGKPDAPVTIVEFSDFECPFCRRASATIDEVVRKYGNEVRVVFRHLPLRDRHPHAQLAAEASRCAADQGKFWEYHDLLFANQAKLDEAGLLEQARVLKLDAATFKGCLESGKHKPEIERDVQEGLAAGVSATPAFFVNGVFLSGAVPAAAFERAIDDELAFRHYQNGCRVEVPCQAQPKPE